MSSDNSTSIANYSEANSTTIVPPPYNPYDYYASSSMDGVCFSYIVINGGMIILSDPDLIFTCIWALYIGVSKHFYFRKNPNTYFYSIVFLMYGVMMTSAMFADVFGESIAIPKLFSFFTAIVDLSLTSNIALFFLYGGLSSVGLMDPSSKRSKRVIGLITALVFITWIYDLLFANSRFIAIFLYDGVVSICGFAFLVLEYIYLKRNNLLSNLKYLVLAGFCGATGILSVAQAAFWCEYFKGISASFYWFFISDVTMLILAIYINKTRPAQYQQVNNV